ncbi:MAG: DEAD/DEAH box helicase [Pseudomonadota bacterium]
MAIFPFTKERAELLDRFSLLALDDQEMLELISIIYEPTTSSHIDACFQEYLGRRNRPQTSPDEPSTAILRRLQQNNLVTWDCRCNPLICEIISRIATTTETFALMATIVQKNLPVQGEEYDILPKKSARHLREMRIGLYLADFEYFNEHMLHYYECPEISDQLSPLVEIINNPFDADWFRTLPPHLQLHSLHEISSKCMIELAPFDLPFAYLREERTLQLIPAPGRPSVHYLRVVHLLLCGDMGAAQTELFKAGDLLDSFGLRGWISFLTGNNEESIIGFRKDLNALCRKKGAPDTFFVGFEGLIFILALLKSGDFRNYATVSSLVDRLETDQPHNPLLAAYRVLRSVAKARVESFKPGSPAQLWKPEEKNGVTSLFMGLGTYWLNGAIESRQQDELHHFFELARKNGFNWLALEYASLLSQIRESPAYQNFSSSFLQETGVVSILAAMPHEKTWQRALKALNIVSRTEEENLAPRYRMVWMVDFKDGFVTLTPREQKLTAKGHWSQGRTISLKRLYTDDELDFLTEQDRKIRSALHKKESSQTTTFEFDMDEALPALVGHPLLFSSRSPNTAIEFVKGEPELRANVANEKLHLKFSHPIGDEKILVLRETPTRFSIVEISPKHRKISAIIGDDGLLVPLAAQREVLATLGNLSSCLTIHSDIGESPTNIEKIPASAQIIAQLLPVGTGFRISLLVRPFSDSGPYLHPGRGAANVIAEINGRRLQALRNLKEERENCERIETLCPTLARLGGVDEEWIIEDIQDCLEVLSEIQHLGDLISVEWPEGQRLAIRHQASFSNLHLHIRQKKNWFELDGKLSVSPDLVLEMKQLLELSRSNHGRFIPLGQGAFLALSREFRRQLDELNSFTDETRGSKRRIHHLAASALEKFTESGITITADQKWQEQLQRLRESRALEPEVPSTLQARLRDYQIEGFKWLARLYHWGVGACLADDMGLGKTVQTLGIILQEARNGPSLVVAPTSVCMNWEDEIKKFTPTLNGVIFGGKDRTDLVENLAPFDVLICSYGLLQQENKLLATREWQVIVLDEAQAIKNIATKRSRAAMELKGNFRMITTGTPIENHLGELWNLFNFINPGLLGSLDHFNHRFAYPIEKERDNNARRKLKKLIQPFILRRLKSQVLEELPPRTEVVLNVDMTQEEAAFYEALRQNALRTIERDDISQPQRQMQILAEIMKLRLACCNPRLVSPESTVHCSKLELFGTIISELIENRHKALVFSQFSSNLKIIRSFLDDLQISYKYLDGSTPPRKRQEQVADFQAGDGDVFLISLKAGGVGLNLTAADYVIHMDPWWNPAVEDQASDRAHRIGQMLPVTVYRLITRNTIEEKILTLHHSKRELAENLLEGSDLSHRMTADELLRMIKNT